MGDTTFVISKCETRRIIFNYGVEAIPFYNFVKNGCGPNEYYVGPNNDCEPSCIEPQPVICSKFGGLCYCNRGYLRNPNGDCVENAKCPNKLPPNKIYWIKIYEG
ncbi:chymotrypsin inhibitor-like [Cotesia typhae]|uniref:chymotrypsin inhibitor-like n=1 Tax=Cotesia typhae TaxID=2053667 RepID=UPI003D69C84E